MTSSTVKTLSFISRKAPYGESYAQACLDMVLSASVFEQRVNYIFMDDGVYQLMKNQHPAAIESKNLASVISTLELYGIDHLYVEKESLSNRGLKEHDLAMKVITVSCQEISDFIEKSDMVFNL